MVFYGSGSILEIKTNLRNFRNYQILRKSDGSHKNHKIKEGFYRCFLAACNWTKQKNEVPIIRDGLVEVLSK